MKTIEVQVGQIWRYTKNRHPYRYLLVGDVEGNSVACWALCAPKPVETRKDRMEAGSAGYILVTDSTELAAIKDAWGLNTAKTSKKKSVLDAVVPRKPGVRIPGPVALEHVIRDLLVEQDLETFAELGILKRREGPAPTEEKREAPPE